MCFSGVEAALRTYFDVMYHCDMQKYAEVFHPACSLFTAGDPDLVVRPFEQYRRELIARTPPASVGQSRERERILKIDMLSDRLALAQVQVQIHDKVFVDNLNFARVGDRWMIVAKVYHLQAVI